MDKNNFYTSILNIKSVDGLSVISNIVEKEKNKLLEQTDSLEGYCKYIASVIEEQLKQNNITSYWIDLNELLNVDHVILIAEFKEHEKIKRILIDPTFIQFVKKENRILNYLSKWPSDKIKIKLLLESLINNGFIEIDEFLFNEYLSSFKDEDININLDEFLLNIRLKELDNKKR